MSWAVALYARMFAIGLAVAAPVGAMGVLCMQRTLSRGWRAGMLTGLGIATADGLYAAMAAFGIGALSSLLVAWQTPLRVVGGLALIALGVRAALAPARACDASDSPDTGTPVGRRGSAFQASDAAEMAAAYAGAVGLTLTNPMTIIAFGAIFAGAGLVAQPGLASAALATAGVASGSLCWWAILVSGIALARRAVGNHLLAGINVFSGCIVALFGVIAVASVCLG